MTYFRDSPILFNGDFVGHSSFFVKFSLPSCFSTFNISDLECIHLIRGAMKCVTLKRLRSSTIT